MSALPLFAETPDALALRPYQIRGLEDIRTLLRGGERHVLVVSPVGSGKSVLIAKMAEGAAARCVPTLLLAHRLELVEQLSAKLDALGLDHGIIQGGHPRSRPHLPLQVASVPTLIKRLDKLPEAGLVITDEAQHCTSASHHRILERYPNAVHVGLTATPYRLDGRGLGEQYKSLVVVAQVADLISQGFLVPSRVLHPGSPDLSGVHTVRGDYNQVELAGIMGKPEIVGDAVETYLQEAAGRTAVAFCVDIPHSKTTAELFCRAGVRAEHLDFNTPPAERRAILARVASGETLVLCNRDICTEGWDVPRISCVIKLRPTQSRALDHQMEGRGLRPFCPSCGGWGQGCLDPRHQHDCVILDHAGNVTRHGLIAWPEKYSLDGITRRQKAALPRIKVCKGVHLSRAGCFTVNAGHAKACFHCDRPFPPPEPRKIAHIAGVLREMTASAAGVIAASRTQPVRARVLAQLMATQRAKGYSPYWPKMKYQGIYKTPPDPETRRLAEQLVRQRVVGAQP